MEKRPNNKTTHSAVRVLPKARVLRLPVLRAPAPAGLDFLGHARPVGAPLPALLRRLVLVPVGVAAAAADRRVLAGLRLVEALGAVILEEAVVGQVVAVLVDEGEVELVARVGGDEIDLERFRVVLFFGRAAAVVVRFWSFFKRQGPRESLPPLDKKKRSLSPSRSRGPLCSRRPGRCARTGGRGRCGERKI